MRPRRGRGYPRDREGGARGGGLRDGPGGSAGYCVLRKGVTRETDRETAATTRLLIIGIVPVEDPTFSHKLPQPS